MARRKKSSVKTEAKMKTAPLKAKRIKKPFQRFISLKPAHKLFIVLGALVVLLLAIVLLRGYDVAATVNGESISNSYLDEQFERLPTAYKTFITREQMLDQAINEVLLLQEARKLGLSVTLQEVDDAIAQSIAQSGLDEETFRTRIAEQGLSMNDVRELLQKQLIVNKLVDKEIISKINIPLDYARAVYDQDPESFGTAEQVRASHILILTQSRSESEAKALIEDIATQATPQNFAQLAAQYSEDPGSAVNGGSLGEFARGVMVKPFEDVAFSTPIGTISKPVQTQFGYHLIYVEAHTPSSKANFEDVQDKIIEQLKGQQAQMLIQDYLTKLKANAKIDIK